MRRDSRLSVALHILLHMGHMKEPTSSEALGAMMKINPVVLRRTMAGLRQAGLVHAEKGHGGGWSLARPLGSFTVADVYEALGKPTLFSIGPREERPRCLVEKSVNAAMAEVMGEAEALLVSRLRKLSVAEVAADVGEALPSLKKGKNKHV